MLTSPNSIATIAPASPLPVPKPPAAFAAWSPPMETLIRPNAAATVAPVVPLAFRRTRFKARFPIIIPTSPPSAAILGKSRPEPIPPESGEAYAIAGIVMRIFIKMKVRIKFFILFVYKILKRFVNNGGRYIDAYCLISFTFKDAQVMQCLTKLEQKRLSQTTMLKRETMPHL